MSPAVNRILNENTIFLNFYSQKREKPEFLRFGKDVGTYRSSGHAIGHDPEHKYT